ncbi:MAG: hypothetical protein ICV83_07830 [Cytophagales bacterium]|nr:hypothetical protein [Cytophagales bacterium]
MKIFLKVFFVMFALNACNEFDASQHPSFQKLENFIQAEKRLARYHIRSIHIDDYNIWEHQQLKPNSSELEYRKITASYDLTLKNGNKEYTSKAEVSSTDSVTWEITSLSITHQTDSLSKHFEETITWKRPVALGRYKVNLKITNE